MKFYIILFTGLLLMVYSCKTKKPSTQQNSQSTEQTPVKPKTLGKVSHQYRVTGCNTVVIVNAENNENPLVLIPKDTLAKEFDKDGLEIYFEYRLLKIKNPAGCSHGIPALISNISKK